MNRMWSVSIVATAILVTALKCPAQDKKIKRSELPLAVEKTVQAETLGATIRGFLKERENGITHFEVEMVVNGHGKEVSMDPNGVVMEVEEVVPFDSLSPAVKHGLKSKAGPGKFAKVESITKRGKLVAYEADVVTNGKKSEVQVGPNGAALDHEE